MTIVDYFDILIISFLIYFVMKFVRETRAEQLLKGILLLVVILLLVRQFNSAPESTIKFKVLGLLSDTFFNVGFMAVIVMFQPELRRVLEKMGRTKMVQSIAFNLENSPQEISTRINSTIEQISLACETLSRSATGALIVIERKTKLGEQVDTGTTINALPSAPLFGNIFFPNSPLHDGAVIIRDGLILAAGCFLPKPMKEELISKDLGTRHRAAIGMSENSDAIVIIVSEETGIISIAENGELTRGFDKKRLSEYLKEKLIKSAENSSKNKKNRKKKIKSEVKDD